MPLPRISPRNQEKFLFPYAVLMTFFSLILLVILLSIAVNKIQDSKKIEGELCLTKDCIQTASMLLSEMELSLDPCENFYEFTCANFKRNNPIPLHKEKTSVFLQYTDRLIQQQIDLIENYDFYGKPDVIFRLQESYHVCINTSYDKEKEMSALKDFVEDVFDGWPMAAGSIWKSKFESVEYYFGTVLRYKFPIQFIDIEEIQPDVNATDDILMQITLRPLRKLFHSFPPGLENETSEDSLLEGQFLYRLVNLFGNYDNVTVLKDFEEIENMSFIVEDLANHQNENWEKMTFGQLHQHTEMKFDWLKMFNVMFQGIHVFNENDTIHVISPDAFKFLPELLTRFSRRAIVNSMVLEAFQNEILINASPFIEAIHDQYAKDKNKFFRILTRQENCLRWLKKIYPFALTRMFVEEYVDKTSITAAEEMIQLLEKSYKQQLQESEWLDEETKSRALNKADKIKSFVGYPEFIFNDEELEQEYSHINKVESTHFNNYIAISLNSSVVDYVSEPYEEERRWPHNPLDTNAAYTPLGNAIWFPTGVLELPFFDINRTAAVNFGMIGSIIGHELGHAFDTTGRLFDEEGNERQWWTQETEEIFTKKSECFVEQYNNYCPERLQTDEEKVCIDGTRTLGENLADNTGLKASYQAYKMWTEEHGEEERLPGLEHFSLEQIFFISFAHTWCEHLLPERELKLQEIDVHSPGRYRVIGVLSNSQYFQDAFECKEGQMNRGNAKCTLW